MSGALTNQRLFAGFSLGQVFASVVAALIVAGICGALAAYVAQARTLDRLSSVETQVKDLREHTITRGEFDAYKETVKEIREDVREIRRFHEARRP